MRDYVEVRRASELEEEVWNFIFLDSVLYLNSYGKYTRATKRHKFSKSVEFYERLGGNHYDRGTQLTEVEVRLPQDVKDEAFTTFVRQITEKLNVMKWGDRNR